MTIRDLICESTNGDIFSRLLKSRILFLSDEINRETAGVIISSLLLLDKESEELITIYILSPGGDINSFKAIYDVMQMIKSPIETICIGEASSAAAILLSAGTKGMRKASVNSRIMIHQVQIDYDLSGSGTDLENFAKEVKRDKKDITEILARHTQQVLSKVYEDCEEDNYMSADEALNYGIIDEIIKPSKSIPKLKTKKSKSKSGRKSNKNI